MNSTLIDEKRFYDRFWALHADPELTRVMARFGYVVFRRSSVLEGFSAFIKAQGFGGKRCIEIGTCKGLTALVLSRHFEEVVSIDIQPDDEKHEIAEHFGRTNIRFVDVRDNAHKAEIIRDLEFDAAYVDGDHARDTLTDFDLVKRCGRVLFHEYWDAQLVVWDLVNRLRGQGHVATSGKLALWTR